MKHNAMKLDLDADGSQWIYKKCIVVKQDHPLLLKYASYFNERLIGVSNSMEGVKSKVNKHLSNG